METNGQNDDLDEDIQRLQIVLQDEEEKEGESDAEGELQSLHQDAEDEHRSYLSRSRPSTCSDVTASSYPPTSVGPEGEDRYQFLDPNNASPESCLAMNRAYQEVLLDLLRQTELSLNENRSKQKELEEEIERLSTGSKQTGQKGPGKTFAFVTIPYFKDNNGDCPPDNADVEAKKDLQESKQHVRPQASWSKFARKKLISAVAMDTLEKMVRPVMSRMELETEKLKQCKNKEEIDSCKDRIEALQEEIQDKRNIPESELIKNVDSDKVDWMKISVSVFDCKMDAADCERTWKNILRPEINREAWTEEEKANLQTLVERHSMRNWKEIARELGTNRTPYQCLQHYQQHSQVYDNSPWTPEEDELLKEVVETCKFGKDVVHFHQVAYYIDGRSAIMCRRRWEEINPQKKRGRWTAHEDCLLTAAVKMFGTNNWLKVAELVPTRNTSQCRERWINVLCPDLCPKIWTYEEDKELLRLIQLHGTNWTNLSKLLSGRTDNSIMQRYKRLMIWKQQCEDFFALPEKLQKSMIQGHREVEKKKRSKRDRKRKHTNPNNGKPNTPDMKWYKKLDFKNYSDVGYLAKQLGVQEKMYDKIIEDKEKGQLVAPRPLPITKYMARNNIAMWKRKCFLQRLVEAEIKKVMDENQDNDYQPREVADRVAANLEPEKKNQWNEINKAMKCKNPSELSVDELLKISRRIGETGKAPSDTDEPEHIKPELNDGLEDEEETGETDQIPKTGVRPMCPNHKMKMMAGRGQHLEINKILQKVIWSKYIHKKGSFLHSGRHRKYRLFPKKVFRSQGSAEEQEKLRRKSLLLMLKSMDVDSIQAFRKARKRVKKFSAFLNLPKDDNRGNNDSSMDDNTRHSLRRKSSSSIVFKPYKRKPEMGEAAKWMLELGKELNVPENDSENEDDNENIPPPRKVARLSTEKRPDQSSDSQISSASLPGSSEEAQNAASASSKRLESTVESQGESVAMLNNMETGSQENCMVKDTSENTPEPNTPSQSEQSTKEQSLPITIGTAVTAADCILDGADSTSSSVRDKTGTVNSDTVVSSTSKNTLLNMEGTTVDTKQGTAMPNTETKAYPNTETCLSENSSAENKSKTTSSVSDPPGQPYTKRLPFIPPNKTNLLAMKALLMNKEKLFDEAAREFKVAELREEFHEKPKTNDTPFVRTLLSIINPDKERIRKRAKRKINRVQENISFAECMEKVKKSCEFTQLRARFCAMFTWPALVSTIKPPKEDPYSVSGQNSTITDQNGKDSEKENLCDISIKEEVLSDEYSSDSDSDVDIGKRFRLNRKHLYNPKYSQPVNDNEERSTGTGGRGRKVKQIEMVPLVYRDLEEMGDVDLTEKDEMDIMVMNIITRRLGEKKKEIPRAQYNRERGKTLKRLGMLDKMKALEAQEIKMENKGETSETEEEPKQKKKRTRHVSVPAESAEPRRSSRLRHHKSLETWAPKTRKVREVSCPEQRSEVSQDSFASDTNSQSIELDSSVATGAVTSTTADSVLSVCSTHSSDTPSLTVSADSSLMDSAEITASAAAKPLLFTLPAISTGSGASSPAASAVSTVAKPFIIVSPQKLTNSGSAPLTDISSGTMPLVFASPVGSDVSSSQVSSFGLFTLPVLPSAGLPVTGSSTTLSSTPLPVIPSASVSMSAGLSSDTKVSTSVTSNAVTSDTAGSVNLQALLGNNLIPVIVDLVNDSNTGSLGIANSVSVIRSTFNAPLNSSALEGGQSGAITAQSPISTSDTMKTTSATCTDTSESPKDCDTANIDDGGNSRDIDKCVVYDESGGSTSFTCDISPNANTSFNVNARVCSVVGNRVTNNQKNFNQSESDVSDVPREGDFKDICDDENDIDSSER